LCRYTSIIDTDSKVKDFSHKKKERLNFTFRSTLQIEVWHWESLSVRRKF